MDSKITLSFDEAVIKKAKKYAAENNTSLSRMIEFLLQKVTSTRYQSFEDFPISKWVNELAKGEGVYKTKRASRKALKSEFYKSRK